jgi:hypothetical protein
MLISPSHLIGAELVNLDVLLSPGSTRTDQTRA